MRTLAIALAIMLAASIAFAGPNAGGVLWVHDTGIAACTDAPIWPPRPPHCAAVDNQMPVYTSWPGPLASRFWKVYAGFPLGSSPRLKTVGWRTEYTDAASSPYSYVSVTGSACSVPDEDGPGTDFFLGDLGFPALSGGQILQSFPTGPRCTTVTTLFIFAGYGYNYGGTFPPPVWRTVPHSDPSHRVFGDDAVPANEDPIMGYSSLGFGAPGTTPCSGWPGSCCYPDGSCLITDHSQCTGVFTSAGICDPNPCPDLTGVNGGRAEVSGLQVLAAPNPSSGVVVIRCVLPRRSPSTVALFDASGRLVRHLHDGELPAGETALSWDGRDDGGRAVPAGVYLVKIALPEGEARGRVTLLP